MTHSEMSLLKNYIYEADKYNLKNGENIKEYLSIMKLYST